MALTLPIPEEGEFSSRIAAFSLEEEEVEIDSPTTLFRWGKSIKKQLGAEDATIATNKLVIAMPGAPQQFIHHVTSEWTTIGTVISSDQTITSCRLDTSTPLTCSIKAKTSDMKAVDVLVIQLSQEVSELSTWNWMDAVLSHIYAEEILCLDSQLAGAYENGYPNESYPLLRTLTSASVSKEVAVRKLETPRFVTGLSAAFLTHGELRQKRVHVFVAIRDFTTLPSDVIKSFLQVTSVLGLEQPLSFQTNGRAPRDPSLVNDLYT